ncbi:MAG: flagellar filament capping protein FliD [Proteobacteria bacterium]|nr:flagellar filament capping protein FliD [Pseudomonadota bacterium]
MVTTTSSTSATSATTSVADPATTGSALLTALGGGTGIDMTALATNIANATYLGKNANITTQLNKLQVQISEATQLKSDLVSLAQSLGNAIDGGALLPAPSVANSAVATASLPFGSAGASGSYSLEVSKLAGPQVLSSSSFAAATTPVGSGSLTINFGTVSGRSFTADASHSPVTVTIAAGATLSDVAYAINQSGAGISAYVATGAGGAQLVMKGADGAAGGFTISASETPGDPGLAALAWDPATGDPARLAQQAQDAAFKLDGISRTSPSNTVANAAPGLSLKLTGTNVGAPTQVSFSDPSSGIVTAMQNLTQALNAIVSELHSDRTANAGGDLQSDSGARALDRALASLPGTTVMPGAATGAPSTLSDLGLTTDKDGNFSLDGTKLTAALSANPQGVAAMFTKGISGVYNTIQHITFAATAPNDPASLNGSLARYTALQTTLNAQQAKLATQQTALRTRLVNQFARANSNVASSNSTLSYLKNQIAAWNKSGN